MIAQAMADRLRHRGPDGDGVFSDEGVALGHRRLAIIDPSPTGAQPMTTPDGRYTIVFNGEIYNFKELRGDLTPGPSPQLVERGGESRGEAWRSSSDTEVILAAYAKWGEDCVTRLRGMFAFAIWDSVDRTLFLARDRVGIKPLVYVETAGGLAFASELQALHVTPDFDGGIDLFALDLYLHFQYIPAPFSIYRSVRKLPPGHTLTWDAKRGVRGPTRYWSLQFQPDRKIGEDEWLERLDAALRDSVRCHLVSDVDFGAFLSGGLDSSTVVAYMSELLDRPVKTFSIGFEHDSYDETRYAREVSRRFGTEHHEEIVRPDALECLPALARHYGEPFADSSAIPTYYVSRLARRHVPMVLSGDGGDENFAGYSTYAALAHAVRTPGDPVGRARHAAGNLLRRAGLRPALPRAEDIWFGGMGYFDASQRKLLWRAEHREVMAASRGWFDEQMGALPAGDLVTRFQAFDIAAYLPYDILTKVDVASMCHGLEVRVPLLDHEFMELAARVPPELKLRFHSDDRSASTGKYLLKRNAEGFLPKDLIYRPKKGFAVPVSEWFRGPLAGVLESMLDDSSPGLGGWFDVSYVRGLLGEHRAGRDHGWRLWSLTFLGEWLRQNS